MTRKLKEKVQTEWEHLLSSVRHKKRKKILKIVNKQKRTNFSLIFFHIQISKLINLCTDLFFFEQSQTLK